MRRIKVAAHVHSEWSYDGRWTLPALAASFRRRGFDAVLMSEHDQGFDAARWADYQSACAAASGNGLLLVPGIEYADEDNCVHIPVWGDVGFLNGGPETETLLRRARDEGGFSVFAHPWRHQAWRRFDPSWVDYLGAVEIWNRKYDGWAPNRDAIRFAQQTKLRPFVSLDFHTRRQFFPLSLSVGVEGEVTRQSVQASIAAGRFQPMFISHSALRFTSGVPARALAAVELARRRAARLLRQ